VPERLDPEQVASDARRLAEIALAEDGARDITTEVVVGAVQQASAVIASREVTVMAGRAWADAVVTACGLPPIIWQAEDGEVVPARGVVGQLDGDLQAILRAERPLLNILQRSCGIATVTRRYADAIKGTGCQVLHTRKTTPGLRLLEVSAVLAGGGGRHRLDLADTVMIKDNHWQALGESGRTLAAALDAARARGVTGLYVEVESMEQLRAACEAGATRVMIDNQEPDVVEQWTVEARRLSPRIEVEATGGITFATLREFVMAGVDYVSTGALTHSVRGADLGLDMI
jgi:nicotinate-nucleotide pyrophosphorylase (carboxylating)